jgi:adenosylcobinamide kinase/adenosylcobinamide-phosphate guanylyltransferase
MLAGRQVEQEMEELAIVSQASGKQVIYVTNEVGCGIVPENGLARAFRDNAGRLNQRIASIADEVYWMVFGQPLRVK